VRAACKGDVLSLPAEGVRGSLVGFSLCGYLYYKVDDWSSRDMDELGSNGGSGFFRKLCHVQKSAEVDLEGLQTSKIENV
jgi:hypothetical protein